VQIVPEVQINRKTFENVTLRVQNISSPYLSLINGETYYVVVRATNSGAQRLKGNASSAGVKVPSFHTTLKSRCMHAMAGLDWSVGRLCC
jgi:hypothetical protein